MRHLDAVPARGICSSGHCEQGSPSPLLPVWTWSSGTSTIKWQGLADEAGNLYFVEAHPDGAADLVSLSATGALRFRTRLPDALPTDTHPEARALMLTDDAVLVSRGQLLGAWRTGDGTLLWRVDLLPELKAWPETATAKSVHPYAAVHPTRAAKLHLLAYNARSLSGEWMWFVIDAASGVVEALGRTGADPVCRLPTSTERSSATRNDRAALRCPRPLGVLALQERNAM